RAERRHREMLADGEDVSFEEVLENLNRRDNVDCRQWVPLLKPEAAILIDTTHMSLKEVVDRLESEIKSICTRGSESG
ncbi:MAG: (d)CMP kinase, partial [Phycisphaerales bacterium]